MLKKSEPLTLNEYFKNAKQVETELSSARNSSRYVDERQKSFSKQNLNMSPIQRRDNSVFLTASLEPQFVIEAKQLVPAAPVSVSSSSCLTEQSNILSKNSRNSRNSRNSKKHSLKTSKSDLLNQLNQQLSKNAALLASAEFGMCQDQGELELQNTSRSHPQKPPYKFSFSGINEDQAQDDPLDNNSEHTNDLANNINQFIRNLKQLETGGAKERNYSNMKGTSSLCDSQLSVGMYTPKPAYVAKKQQQYSASPRADQMNKPPLFRSAQNQRSNSYAELPHKTDNSYGAGHQV